METWLVLSKFTVPFSEGFTLKCSLCQVTIISDFISDQALLSHIISFFSSFNLKVIMKMELSLNKKCLQCAVKCVKEVWSESFIHTAQETAPFCSYIMVVMGNISHGLFKRSWTGEESNERKSWEGIIEREEQNLWQLRGFLKMINEVKSYKTGRKENKY